MTEQHKSALMAYEHVVEFADHHLRKLRDEVLKDGDIEAEVLISEAADLLREATEKLLRAIDNRFGEVFRSVMDKEKK